MEEIQKKYYKFTYYLIKGSYFNIKNIYLY